MVQAFITGPGTGIIITPDLVPGDSICIIHPGRVGLLVSIIMAVGLILVFTATMGGIAGVVAGGGLPGTGLPIVGHPTGIMDITVIGITSSM